MAGTEVLLAIDGGKSELRVAIADGGRIQRATGPGFTYEQQDDIEAQLAAIGTVVTELAPQGLPILTRVCAGLTGIPGSTGRLRQLETALAERLGVQAVAVTDDSVTAHAGALGTAGVVVCAGTGAVVLALAPDGRSQYCDGWGPWLGDRGSGAAIGLAGLRAASGALDRAGPETSLIQDFAELLGGVDRERVQQFHRAPQLAPRIAAFAVAVAERARLGDQVSLDILADAGRALAATARAAATGLGLSRGGSRVCIVGRLTAAGPALLEPFAEACRRGGLQVVPARADALAGGLELASGRRQLYADLLARPPALTNRTRWSLS